MSTLRVDNLRGQTADGTNRYVVQVVQHTGTSTNTTTSSSFVDTTCTGSITPLYSTSKILVTVSGGMEGTAGGGMVKIIMNCKNEVKKIELDPSIIKEEEKQMMEDLIVAALNDAKTKAEEKSKEEMAKLTGDLGLPPGMKMPF